MTEKSNISIYPFDVDHVPLSDYEKIDNKLHYVEYYLSDASGVSSWTVKNSTGYKLIESLGCTDMIAFICCAEPDLSIHVFFKKAQDFLLAKLAFEQTEPAFKFKYVQSYKDVYGTNIQYH